MYDHEKTVSKGEASYNHRTYTIILLTCPSPIISNCRYLLLSYGYFAWYCICLFDHSNKQVMTFKNVGKYFLLRASRVSV